MLVAMDIIKKTDLRTRMRRLDQLARQLSIEEGRFRDCDTAIDVVLHGRGSRRLPAGPTRGHPRPGDGPHGPGRRYSRFPGGSLLGRIGVDGEIFVIGKKYAGLAPRDGKVYLAVCAYQSHPTGSYDVRITAGEP